MEGSDGIELTDEHLQLLTQGLEVMAVIYGSGVVDKAQQLEAMSGDLPPCLGSERWEDLSLQWKEVHKIMVDGSKEKVGEWGPWDLVTSTWEGMTMMMLLLKEDWEEWGLEFEVS